MLQVRSNLHHETKLRLSDESAPGGPASYAWSDASKKVKLLLRQMHTCLSRHLLHLYDKCFHNIFLIPLSRK